MLGVSRERASERRSREGQGKGPSLAHSQEARFAYPNCLISYRAGAWHYRVFPDFLNSGLKMASKIEGNRKVIACSWNDIKGQITPES